MITLKDIAKSDRAVGAITTDECRLVAAVLDAASKNWFFRLTLPKEHREKGLSMRMLAGVLNRTPAERTPVTLQVQIYNEMQRNK